LLSLDSIVRQNSGGVANLGVGATITPALAGGETTEAGNTLIVGFTGGTGQQGVPTGTPPSGWTVDVIGTAGATVFRRGPAQGLAAGESSWNFTGGGTAGPVAWIVLELAGLSSVDGLLFDGPVDAFDAGGQAVASSGTTLASKPSGLSSTYDGLALAFHNSHNNAGTTPDTWDSHTNGFTEIAESGQAGSSTAVTLSVSALPVQQLGSYSTTATCSRTLTAGGPAMAGTTVLTAAGARRAANLMLIDGAEHGLITGNTLGPSNAKILETVTGPVSISGAAARSGSHGYLFNTVGAAAACNITRFSSTTWVTVGVLIPFHIGFRFDTLPTVDTDILTMLTLGAANALQVRYIASSGKLDMKAGTGSVVLSDQAVTVDQYFVVHALLDMRTSTFTVDWAVDYNAELTDTTPAVAQTQATGAGTANSTIGTHRTGWSTSIAAAMHSDDLAIGKEPAHYPFGDLRVLPVKVDPAGTPTISGTATNFGVMTANGSVAAWNAANARNAVDDVPPDLSGTRDAAVALLAHASDYAEFPMDTLDLAALGVYVRGVRFVIPLWAASATAATIRLFAYDGTTQYILLSEQDPQADNTATPVWVAKTVRPTSGRIDWTQAKLDALVFRFGSNDATPDIGVDMILAEVAVVKAQPEVLFGSPGDPVYVAARRDLDTNGLIGMDITTVGAGATIIYEVDSVAQTPVVVAADTTVYEPIGAADFLVVNRIDLVPD
jgi:hypothetical protein